MKGFLIVPTVTAVLLSGCSKPSASTDNQPPEATTPPPAQAPAPAPKPVASSTVSSTSPDKTPAKSTEEPAAPAKVFAPEGTLFALQRITITNDDGVFSVPGGTKLKIVRKAGEGYVVSDGKREFSVEAQQVTNEVTAASAATQVHVTESTANRAAAQAQTAAQLELAKNQQAQAAAAIAADDKDRQIRAYQSKALTLANEIADLQAKISQSVTDTQESWRATHIYGKVSTRTVDPTLVAGYRRRLAVAQEEKKQVDAALIQLQFPR